MGWVGDLFCQLLRRLGEEPLRPDPGHDWPPLRPQEYLTDILEIGHEEFLEFQEWEDEARRKARGDYG